MKIFLVVFASFTGGIAGYLVGVAFACSSPTAGNLCGLLGAFVTGPIGFLAGGIGSIAVLARQRR